MPTPISTLPPHLQAILAGSVKIAPSMPPVQSRATPRAQRHTQQETRRGIDAREWEPLECHETPDTSGGMLTMGEW